jgi:hypothetical protein
MGPPDQLMPDGFNGLAVVPAFRSTGILTTTSEPTLTVLVMTISPLDRQDEVAVPPQAESLTSSSVAPGSKVNTEYVGHVRAAIHPQMIIRPGQHLGAERKCEVRALVATCRLT